MKKALLATALCMMAATAAIAGINDELYIVEKNGRITTIDYMSVDSIVIDPADTLMQRIYCTNKVINIPVDSLEDMWCNYIATPDSMVDLGLSVKWNSCNIGASEPSGYGELVGWGDPTGTHTEQWSTASYGSYMANKDLCMSYYGGVTPPDSIGGTDIDIAHVRLGGGWRMPTRLEFLELMHNCVWRKCTVKMRLGVLITSRTTGNSIFLPASGMRRGSKMTNPVGKYGAYWSANWYGNSSSTSKTKSEQAWALGTLPDNYFSNIYGLYRYSGICVRPVIAP